MRAAWRRRAAATALVIGAAAIFAIGAAATPVLGSSPPPPPASSAACAHSASGATSVAARASGIERARHLMGTRLIIATDDGATVADVEAAFDEVARLERILSNWDEGSEISRLNRVAAVGTFHCSPELFAAIDGALHWARQTGGAFDPTVEPLTVALGLRATADAPPRALPAAATADIGRPASTVGWRHVRLQRGSGTVRFDAAGVGLDFGGIGKGIALDAAARLLRQAGARAALLDFGGQLLAVGPESGTYRVGIAAPGDRRSAPVTAPLRNASIATSGDDARPGPGGGHIIDPARGGLASFRGTATVIMPAGESADALSTALYVMGPEAGIAWAEARSIAALYQWRGPDGSILRAATTAFPPLEPEARP